MENKRNWNSWTEREKKQFERLYASFGKDFERYECFFPGRTAKQIQCFYYNCVNRNREEAQRKQREFTSCVDTKDLVAQLEAIVGKFSDK